MTAKRPSMRELWEQAGAGTTDYDRAEYLELLREYGYTPAADLPPLGDAPGSDTN